MAPVRALLTAFGPFGGRDQNQSQQVLEHCLRRLPEPWRAQLLPVQLDPLRAMVRAQAQRADLRLWLALGEAGRDGPPVLELDARNRCDFRQDPASAGGAGLQGAVEEGGPERIALAAPVARLAAALRAGGHDLELSTDAGSHCCNALLYAAARAAAAAGPEAPWILFLHLPRRPEALPAQAGLVLDALAWLGTERGL